MDESTRRALTELATLPRQLIRSKMARTDLRLHSNDVLSAMVLRVAFCGGVRGRCAFGSGDVPFHRCGGFDASVGGRRRRDALALAAHDELLRGAVVL